MKLFKITTTLVALWSFGALAEAPSQGMAPKASEATAQKPLKIGGGAAHGGYNAIAKTLKLSSKKGESSSPEVRVIATGGSVTNIKAIKHGEFKGGIAQANIGDAAFRGVGVFSSYGPDKNLRSIARLYPEYVHFVVKADSPIQSIADLKGKHVGLGSAGSGTLEASVKILKAFGVKELDVNGHYSRISQIIETFKRGKLDGFFFISTSPSAILARLHEEAPLKLVPIEGPQREAFLHENESFTQAALDGSLYGLEGDVNTLSVNAQLFVSKDLDEKHAYEITKNLWESTANPASPLKLDRALALNSLAAPLHPGAAAYYREQKVLRN